MIAIYKDKKTKRQKSLFIYTVFHGDPLLKNETFYDSSKPTQPAEVAKLALFRADKRWTNKEVLKVG